MARDQRGPPGTRLVEAGGLAGAGEAGDIVEAGDLVEAGGLAGLAGGLAGVVEAGDLAGVVTTGLGPASRIKIPTIQIHAIITTDQITMNSTVSTSIKVFVFVQTTQFLIHSFYISVEKIIIF